MTSLGVYIIPIVVGIFGFSALALIMIYTRWRMRLHKKGILDLRYDGHAHIGITQKNIFDLLKEEREYDRKHRK